MGISYNVAKSEANILDRGLSFEAARDFVMSSALIVEDCRSAYLERRFQALGLIANRLHMLVFTPRDNRIHVISLRKSEPS